MKARTRRTGYIAVGLASWLGAALCFNIGSPGAQPRPAAQAQNTSKPTKLYFGVRACSSGGCHDRREQNKDDQDIILCRYNEVQIWQAQDKHKDANKVLKSERGQQMAKLLGIQGDITKEPSCITCHGVLVENDKLVHKPSFSLEDGVSCAVCHGPYKEWVGKHHDLLEREDWRALSRKVKEEQFGMKDLWDPVKRAALCVSCHIGNSAEGKVVTHTMFAAGHPPLPGIEVATFSDAMPRHWQYLAEKPKKVQKILEYDAASANWERTQLVVVAGLVSFRASMNLLAAQAEEGAAAKDPDKSWPELAQFDCYACHHDLKSKSWRQKRGYTGPPGRPGMRPWPLALVHAGLVHAAAGDDKQEEKLRQHMQTQLKDVHAAFNAKPFGDPVAVARAARQTALWADGLLVQVQNNRFDEPASHRLLLGLGRLAQHDVDFDSARQISWAARVVHDERHFKKSTAKKDEEVERAFEALEKQLQLDLPKGQVEIGKTYLQEALRKLSEYEPEQFQTTFRSLMKHLEKRQ